MGIDNIIRDYADMHAIRYTVVQSKREVITSRVSVGLHNIVLGIISMRKLASRRG